MKNGDKVMVMYPDMFVIGRVGMVVKAFTCFDTHLVAVAYPDGGVNKINYPGRYLVKVV